MADLRHLPRPRARPRVAALLERFDLGAVARRPASTYSGGLRRRLDLAMTLLGDPRIVFLDEPTTGLDPRSRRDVWDAVRELVAGGATILLTTQYLEEADQLADRVAVLDHGHVVAEGTPAQLKASVPGAHVRLTWLCVALDMISDSVETASNLPMPLLFLPFLGSAFVPATSMPGPLAWFATYQPFTPVIETVRGLLAGTPVAAGTLGLALAWVALIALTGRLAARRLYERRS